MKKACVIFVLLIFLSGLLGALAPEESEPRLSAEQMDALRERYPVYTQDPPTVDTYPVPFERLCERIDTFAYVEITGDIQYYSKNISMGDAAWDAKHGTASSFFEYPAVVISDTENKFKAGEKIMIAANMMFYGYIPELSPGMKLVFAATGEGHRKGQYGFSKIGTYYITEDGFALSAFDEELYKMKETLSGVELETLMYELGKLVK
ncbi:MAG: hypothetical protein IJP38_05630 [Oscillospiraceae bacterium]|nr:hypothetical protein [Oscillospiraceae bacterium]